jgi:rhodanese-related sulfurtransferase
VRNYLRPVMVIIGLLTLVSTGLAGCGQSSPASTATYQNASVSQAMTLMAQNSGNPNFVIIDVRTPAEFAAGHIANAINIDLNSGTFDTEIVKQDKSKKYLVYCHTGNRSATASGKMVRFGFTDVTNMTGGISDWEAAGYPTVQ